MTTSSRSSSIIAAVTGFSVRRDSRSARHRHAHFDLLTRSWKLRDNVTAYDAMYVALAEALGATVVTCDTPLAKAPGHRAHIEVIV